MGSIEQPEDAFLALRRNSDPAIGDGDACFAAGIKATNAWSVKTHGKTFDRLSPADRGAVLTAMETGQAQFDGLEAKPFFEALLQSAHPRGRC